MTAGLQAVNDLLVVVAVRRADDDSIQLGFGQHLLVVVVEGQRRQRREALLEAINVGREGLGAGGDDRAFAIDVTRYVNADHVVPGPDQADSEGYGHSATPFRSG